jgi:hypothetical protein
MVYAVWNDAMTPRDVRVFAWGVGFIAGLAHAGSRVARGNKGAVSKTHRERPHSHTSL